MATSIDFNFNLPSTGGGMLSLDNFPGTRAFVIIFTCNHCPYAVAYEDRLRKMAEAFAGEKVQLIAISSNDAEQYPQDSFSNMQERAEKRNFNFPYLYDESQQIAENYGAERTPHAFVLQRTIRGLELVYSGAIDDNYENAERVKASYVVEVVNRILKGEPVRQESVSPVGCSIKWKPRRELEF